MSLENLMHFHKVFVHIVKYVTAAHQALKGESGLLQLSPKACSYTVHSNNSFSDAQLQVHKSTNWHHLNTKPPLEHLLQ